MLHRARIQRWGNSSAIRLPAKALAAAGIEPNSDVDIQPGEGCIVIQLPEKTQEEALDALFEDEPMALELLQGMREQLKQALARTDKTIKTVESTLSQLSQRKM